MGLTQEEILKRVEPTHLTTDGLKEEVEKTTEAATKPTPESAPDADPKAQREYTWDFDWKDARGKVWQGKFTNRAPDMGEVVKIGVARARISSNLSLEALDDTTGEVAIMLAHLTYTLIERPDWAKDLFSITNPRLLQEIFMEVLAHEAFFLGYVPTPEIGAEKSKKRDSQAQTVVE